MISGIFGLPGAGKSTFLAWCVSRALQGKAITVGLPGFRTVLAPKKQWKNVYCNFPIKGTAILDPDDLGKYLFEDSLLIIDEIMHYFDNRDWKSFGEDKKYFWSMMRHYGCSAIWCSQSYRDCDLKIRNLTQQFCLIENHGNTSKVIPLTQYQRLEHGQIAEGYSAAPPLGTIRLNRKKYYHMFDSYSRKEYPEKPAALWAFDE